MNPASCNFYIIITERVLRVDLYPFAGQAVRHLNINLANGEQRLVAVCHSIFYCLVREADAEVL